MVKLLDCTTRDGGYSTNWNYSDKYIFDLMETLNREGVDFYEIGYRNYYDNKDKGAFYHCDSKFLKRFYEKKGNLKLGIMVDAKRYDESDFRVAEIDCLDFVRIAVRPDRIKDSLLIAENLYGKNYKIMLQLMDIKNLSEEQYNILNEWEHKNILETLYLADTYGVLKPQELSDYFKRFRSYNFENISFHAHNAMGQALDNSLEAIKLEAYSIDVSQTDGGINGGNLLYKDLNEKSPALLP